MVLWVNARRSINNLMSERSAKAIVPSVADISIVIVNWNGGALLLDCLASIQSKTRELVVETVVVDNDSKDDSVEQVRRRFPEVRVIDSGGNLGFGRACNIGTKATTGALIIFLNPDALLLEGTLEKIHQFMGVHPQVGGVGCMVKDLDGTVQELGIQRDPTPFLEFVKMFAPRRSGDRDRGGWLPRKDPRTSGVVTKLYGACLTVRRDLFERIAGFDDRFFMYCEDVDICRRILADGRSLYYLAEAEVIHNQGSCSRKAPSGFAVLMQCDSLERYMRKYHGSIGAWMYRVLLFVGALVRLIPLSAILLTIQLIRSSNATAWRKKWSRNWTLFRWSLGLAKAFIPD